MQATLPVVAAAAALPITVAVSFPVLHADTVADSKHEEASPSATIVVVHWRSIVPDISISNGSIQTDVDVALSTLHPDAES